MGQIICLCEEHVKLISERAGKPLYREEIENAILDDSLDTISGETGIAVKNLNRFLGYEDFKEYKNSLKSKGKNGNTKITL